MPEIKKRLISVKFNDALNHYESKNSVLIGCLEVAQYLNGAWCIYQQQHNRISLLERRIDVVLEMLVDKHINHAEQTLRGENDENII